MTLSVVIPNYNHGHLLPCCVAALMAQTRKPDEIIIVDDGSLDDSVEVIRALARTNPALTMVQHLHNRGTAVATNTGIHAAQGDYIYMGAADDVTLPKFFEKTVRRLEMYQGAGLCGSICRFTDHTSGLSYKFGAGISETILLPRDVEASISRGQFLVSCCGAMWRRQAVIDAGCFDPALRWHTDWLLLFQVALKHGMAFLPEVLSEFHSTPGSYSNAGKRRTKEQLAVLRAAVAAVKCSGVEERIRRSGAMACFGKEMLYVLLSDRTNWKYLTPSFWRLIELWTARIEAKKLLPDAAVAWWLNWKGLRA